MYPYNPDAIDKSCLMPTVNITPQPAEAPHSSKTPNEIEKGGIMPVMVDEPQYSTPIQKPSQSNQESNSANTVYVTKNWTSSTLPGASSSVMSVPLSKMHLHHLILHILQLTSACHQHTTPQE